MDNKRKVMIDIDQVMKNNPAARVPICLCLDNSASMRRIVRGETRPTGEVKIIDGRKWNVVTGGIMAINDLNEGIKSFINVLAKDQSACDSAEVSIVSFGGKATKVRDFSVVSQYENTYNLVPEGNTFMGEGVNLALDLLEARKEEYKSKGIDYYQPWLVILTDGEPNGDPAEFERAAKRISDMVGSRKLTVFPIGVGPQANLTELAKLSPDRKPLRLDEQKYDMFFKWLVKLTVLMSSSMPGEVITINQADIDSWQQF